VYFVPFVVEKRLTLKPVKLSKINPERILIRLMKVKITIFMVTFLFALSACNAAAAPEQPGAVPPTPAPPALDAPLVQAPALVKFHFINELDGWGATQTQIVRTNDGGVTWYNITPPEMGEAGYGASLIALDLNHLWVQIPDSNNYPNSGFLYRSQDGGVSWSKFATPFSGGDLDFIDSDHGWMLADLGAGAGSEGVSIFQSTDGGSTWTQTYTNDPNQPGAADSLPLGGIKSGLVARDLQTAWVTGVIYADGTIYLYRTDDGGRSWSEVNPPLPDGAQHDQFSIDPDQLKFVSRQDGFLAVRRATINDEYMQQTAMYVTQDAGETWSLTPTLIPKGGSVDFLSATDAVVYNGDQFYVTRDTAQTWNTIAPEIVFGDTFASLDFVNASSGWVLTMDPTTQHSTLYRTTDGGSSWFPVIP